MQLANKLLSFLHRVFNKDPLPFLALRIGCDGTGLSWTVTDGVLTLVPVGGMAAPLTVQLSAYSVASLAAFLSAQPGYAVLYQTASDLAQRSALVLFDGSGNVAQPNGDHLFGYTSVLWAYLDANAAELDDARRQIGTMLQQMNTVTASEIWLDFLGGYYGVARQLGEQDAQYGPRIIATVIRPLGNNVAIEAALQVINGGLPVAVTDVDVVINGSYGLFDVEFAASVGLLESNLLATLSGSVMGLIDRMRVAGTFLRKLNINAPIVEQPVIGGVAIAGATVWVHPA